MKLWARSLLAVLTASISWFLYIYLPEYLLDFVSSEGITLPLPGTTIEIGDIEQLVFYVKSIGYMIVGITFAHSMAEKDTKIKPIWHLIRVFFKILFWGLFIFVEFDEIFVTADLPSDVVLNMTINLTILFWFMMGGIIFDIIATIFDFLAAFIPEKEKKEQIPKNEEIENEMEENQNGFTE